jgi:hypoxanthine phosphoribosyltransferase
MFEERMEKILFEENEIQLKVKKIAKKINQDYANKEPLLVGILKGCFVFMADLIRELTIPHTIDFIDVSSYGNQTESSGIVKIEKDLDRTVLGKDLILIDDIIDTGLTFEYLINHFTSHKPNSIKLCTLLTKPDRRKANLEADYFGFSISDNFVVGYGLGHKGFYRNLKYIGILKKDFQ